MFFLTQFFHYWCLLAVVISSVIVLTTTKPTETNSNYHWWITFICLGLSLYHPVESAEQSQKVSDWPKVTQLINSIQWIKSRDGIWTRSGWHRCPHISYCALLPLKSRTFRQILMPHVIFCKTLSHPLSRSQLGSSHWASRKEPG